MKSSLSLAVASLSLGLVFQAATDSIKDLGPILASATFSSSDCSLAVNGDLPVAVVTAYQPSTAEKLSIGFKTGESGACNFAGQIAELIVFDRVLAAKDRVAVESCLAGKYKLPLPTGG